VPTAVDGVHRHVLQQATRASGAVPQEQEGLLQVDVEVVGQDALCLLDRHPALQGGLQLNDQRHPLL
jgi:hypothetical protein